MTTNQSQPHTAQIYQFPLGGRASVGPRFQSITPMDLRAQNTAPTVAGSGWYHDAAIQDAKQGTEH